MWLERDGKRDQIEKALHLSRVRKLSQFCVQPFHLRSVAASSWCQSEFASMFSAPYLHGKTLRPTGVSGYTIGMPSAIEASLKCLENGLNMNRVSLNS